jgi:hypothetical protein
VGTGSESKDRKKMGGLEVKAKTRKNVRSEWV